MNIKERRRNKAQQRPENSFEKKSFLILGLVSIVGLFLGLFMRQSSPGSERVNSIIFYYLYAHYEPLLCFVSLVLAVTMLAIYLSPPRIPGWLDSLVQKQLSWREVWLLSGFVFFLCLAGSYAVYRNYPLSMDEFAPQFQAQIFLSGTVKSHPPAQFRDWIEALTPSFIVYNSSDDSLISWYLPVHAALVALFGFFGSQALLNPLLGALSLLFIFGCARNLGWQNSGAIATWASLFLAASSQFLITNMSGYSMPAHLCFNLAWLWLYTMPQKKWFLLAPWIGVLAMGLHQPNCHALFAAPFLFRLLLDKRWKDAVYAAAVYSFGIFSWLQWAAHFQPTMATSASSSFGLPSPEQLLIQSLNLSEFVNWQPAILFVCLLVAMRHLRKMPPFIFDLFCGLGISAALYLFFMSSQGHGWGYRYLHQVLGNACLIGAWAMTLFSKKRAILICSAFSLAVSLFLQFPLRCLEVSKVIGQFEPVYARLAALPAEYVIIDANHFWYAGDLARNTPFFTNRPLLLKRQLLSQKQIKDLKENHAALEIGAREFEAWGIQGPPAK